jgi:hypothetical protein
VDIRSQIRLGLRKVDDPRRYTRDFGFRRKKPRILLTYAAGSDIRQFQVDRTNGQEEEHMRHFLATRRCRALLGLVAIGAGSAALADLSNVVFRVTATSVDNPSLSAMFEVTQDQGSWSDDTFLWTLPASVLLTDPDSGDAIGRITGGMARYVADPIISLGFNFENLLPGSVIYQIDSGLLSFPDQAPAQATATAGVTVTDSDGIPDNGAVAIGATGVSGTSCYQANLNGLIPAGSQFAELVAGVIAGDGQSNTASQNTGGLQNVAGAVTSASTQFRLSITGLDSVSGTSNFRIIPEPATLSLLALAGLAVLRRR